MFVVVSWFVDGGVFPEKVDGGGATCERETLSPLLMADGFTASYRRLAMVAFGPLVTRWREARCRCRTSAGRRASCSMEQPLTSVGGVLVDDERRLDDERLIFGIVGSEYVAEKQTVVTKSAGGVACSVNLQLSQKCATVGWRQNVSAHSNGAYLFTRARPIRSARLLTYICDRA